MAPNGEAAGGGSPGAGVGQGDGSPNAPTGTSGTGLSRATGRGQPGQKAETHRWPFRLEHPGQATKPGTLARETKAR